ncbi:MAG: cytochrome ubiquinol oxidase subunit I [Sulfolobales archaeon]
MSSESVNISPAEFLGFASLGISVLIHIIFVSITLGVGVITAIYRWLAYKRSDPELEVFSRRVFRLMIVSELFSGVWGTIITVFLAGFFPGLVALATNLLFTPIAISVASIMIRIPSIAIFWYTWGKIRPEIHSVIGFIMAVSGFGVPLGFRTLFSEITYPHAVAEFLAGGSPSPLYAYTSPLYWALYAHTVFATISTGGFVVASLMSLENSLRGVRIGLLYGLVFLFAQFFAGPLYWYTLHYYSPYIFDQATFGALMPVLSLKMTLIIALLTLGIYALAKISSGVIHRNTLYLGFIAVSIVLLGELLNDASRYPYMVVAGDRGVPISAFFNFYMQVPDLIVYVILGFLVLAIAVFLVASYLAIYKRFVVESVEE